MSKTTLIEERTIPSSEQQAEKCHQHQVLKAGILPVIRLDASELDQAMPQLSADLQKQQAIFDNALSAKEMAEASGNEKQLENATKLLERETSKRDAIQNKLKSYRDIQDISQIYPMVTNFTLVPQSRQYRKYGMQGMVILHQGQYLPVMTYRSAWWAIKRNGNQGLLFLSAVDIDKYGYLVPAMAHEILAEENKSQRFDRYKVWSLKETHQEAFCPRDDVNYDEQLLKEKETKDPILIGVKDYVDSEGTTTFLHFVLCRWSREKFSQGIATTLEAI